MSIRTPDIDGFYETPEEAHADAMAKGALCLSCPLFGIKEGPVPSEIRRNSRLVVLGEAPGPNEVAIGENFVGKSGQILDRVLSSCGFSRERGHVSVINATLCRPGGSKGNMKTFLQKQSTKHSKAQRDERKRAKREGRKAQKLKKPLTPQQACLPRLVRELAEAGGDVIMALGSYALQGVGAAYRIPVGKAKLETRGQLRLASLDKQAGHPFELPETRWATTTPRARRAQREDHPRRDRRASGTDEEALSQSDGSGGPEASLPSYILPARTLLPTYHPAAAMHGDSSIGKRILDEMTLAARIARAGGWEWPDPLELVIPWVKEETITLEETVTDEKTGKTKVISRSDIWAEYEQPEDFLPKVRRFVEEWEARGCPNPTVDIETSGIEWRTQIRCVGFGYGPWMKERVIVVPIRFKSGAPYWRKEDQSEVLGLLRRMLNQARLGGHNFIFDSRHLVHAGLIEDDPVDRVIWYDTMLAYKNTREGNLRRGLDAASTRFFPGDGPNGKPLAIRLWKGDVDHKASDNIQRDADLWWYCGFGDVVVQHRMRKPSFDWVQRDKTGPQFKEDLDLQPVLRNMGELGVLISEKQRLENHEVVVAELEKAKSAILEIVGDDSFNPNSSQQVAEYLYEELGYDPVMNPSGKDWEEGDSMSTSIPALMKLQDENPEEHNPHLWRYVDNQIRFKALDKLRSGFVESLEKYADLVTSGPLAGYRHLHPQFKTSILSGRFASNPNVQNWPKRAFVNLRQMIHAAPGHVFVYADLDQAELRALIVAAGSQMLEDAVLSGMDPHSLNAAALATPDPKKRMGVYEEFVKWKEGPKDDPRTVRASNARFVAKIFFFAAAYGAIAATLYRHMKLFRDKATGARVFDNYTWTKNQRNYDNFHATYPTFKDWHKRINDIAELEGWISDLYDFRKIPFFYGVDNDNEPPNQEIQSTISRQMNQAILKVADAIPFRGWSRYTGIVLQVHDELVVQVPESKVDTAIKILESELPVMLDDRIPIGCEATASRIWTGKKYIPLEE